MPPFDRRERERRREKEREGEKRRERERYPDVLSATEVWTSVHRRKLPLNWRR